MNNRKTPPHDEGAFYCIMRDTLGRPFPISGENPAGADAPAKPLAENEGSVI